MQAQDIARSISGAIAGEDFAQVKTYQVPITNLSPSHLHYLPFATRFPLPHFTLVFYLPYLSQLLSLYLSLSFRLPFSVWSCACLSLWLFLRVPTTFLEGWKRLNQILEAL